MQPSTYRRTLSTELRVRQLVKALASLQMVQTPAVHESGPTKQVGITGRDMQQMQFRQLRLARLASVLPWLFYGSCLTDTTRSLQYSQASALHPPGS